MPGLREQKKVRTRSAIAAAAADLFARDGYANVTMSQVAAAAGVSDQTLYNYFPTKESLVFDRSDLFASTLLAAVGGRAAGVDLVDAYLDWLRAFLLGDNARRALEHPGGMPRLVVSSDGLRRALLDLAHAVATTLAGQLRDAESLPAPVAVVLADAMIAVMVRTIEDLGTAPDPSDLPRITATATAAANALRPLLPSFATQ